MAVHPLASAAALRAAVSSVYQPIVELSTGATVGYEALTRPVANSPWSGPDEMFRDARILGDTVDFDWQCRLSALAGASEAGLPADLALFVNSEPAALDASPPPRALPVLTEAMRLSVVLEITERHLMSDPAGLLRAAAHARDLGWRIAIDDVGSESSSLALLALLRPDVIKLEMRLIQDASDRESEYVVETVLAESERTGAIVVAEGIETALHERRALDLGATWGQGWRYGRPAPLPRVESRPLREDPAGRETHRGALHRGLADAAVTVRAPVAVTPFGLTHGRSEAIVTDEAGLTDAEERLLDRASTLGSTAVVMVTVPAGACPTPSRDAVLEKLAESTGLTVVFGSAVPTSRAYRTVEIGAEEALAAERSIVVVHPRFTAALTAREIGRASDGSVTIDYRITFDRDHVLDAATLLVHRMPASDVPLGLSLSRRAGRRPVAGPRAGRRPVAGPRAGRRPVAEP